MNIRVECRGWALIRHSHLDKSGLFMSCCPSLQTPALRITLAQGIVQRRAIADWSN